LWLAEQSALCYQYRIMRFAEVFLRLGCSLVAWMVLYAHFLWLAALGGIGCGPDGDALHKVLLGLVPVTIGFAFLLRTTKPLEEVHRILRWLGLPLAALMLAGTYHVLAITRAVYMTGQAICSSGVATAWHEFWGPAQLLVIVVAAAMIIRLWRNTANARVSN
jgi:hypothetical protein